MGSAKEFLHTKRALIFALSQIAMQKMNIATQKIEYLNTKIEYLNTKIEYLNAKNNFCIPNFNLGIYICYILFYN